jgi:hypothetical protein
LARDRLNSPFDDPAQAISHHEVESSRLKTGAMNNGLLHQAVEALHPKAFC